MDTSFYNRPRRRPHLDRTRGLCTLIFRRRGRLADDGQGMHCCISSWVRTSDNAIPIRLKCGANYQNGRLACLQATVDGYDGPILLNSQGHVAEGLGASFFMVRKGEVITPPTTADILESITRVTLMQLFQEEMGLTVKEQDIDRTQVYVADEAFFCGSGYEVTPILSVDRFPSALDNPVPSPRRFCSTICVWSAVAPTNTPMADADLSTGVRNSVVSLRHLSDRSRAAAHLPLGQA